MMMAQIWKNWMSEGIMICVFMDSKAENGCQTKTVCCGVSVIVLNLEVVLTASNSDNWRYEQTLPHGFAISSLTYEALL